MRRVMTVSARSSLALTIFSNPKRCSSSLLAASKPKGRFTPFMIKPLCTITATPTTASVPELEEGKRSILLEKLRIRHLKVVPDNPKHPRKSLTTKNSSNAEEERGGGLGRKERAGKSAAATCFDELGVSEEVLRAVNELGIEVPTEIQCIGIPAILERNSVVLGSHTGSGKTLAYLLPLVQLLRQDEALSGVLMKPKRPRAVVLCPTRELCEQVFRVAKAISHHARFRSIMVSGGGRLRPQEDSLNCPVDMIVGTPGRILQHIEEGTMVYGEIKYLVLDEADTMFDRGFGPDIRKFVKPLKNRSSKPDAAGFQTVLVSATMTKGVQNLVDEEFQGILHLRTSSLHKRISSCSHNFIKLSGAENKLEALLQVLEPSLAKGNRVMVFCNTLNSSRAVDHFLAENQISTVNYHGEVPAAQRVENLEKFRNDDGDCPTLVCTDLAARGLDINVDHVIIFDFPSNSIDYVHRTGRTARMGAKGKVTSLVTKKDLLLANRIEEAILKNESLEAFSIGGLRRDLVRTNVTEQSAMKPAKSRAAKSEKTSDVGIKGGSGAKTKTVIAQKLSKSAAKTSKVAAKSLNSGGKSTRFAAKAMNSAAKTGKTDGAVSKKMGALKKSAKVVVEKKGLKNGKKIGGEAAKSLRNDKAGKGSIGGKRKTRDSVAKSPAQKLKVVSFRGKSSLQ